MIGVIVKIALSFYCYLNIYFIGIFFYSYDSFYFIDESDYTAISKFFLKLLMIIYFALIIVLSRIFLFL